jgi:hypothetical protein
VPHPRMHSFSPPILPTTVCGMERSMSSTKFVVDEHKSPCQYVRGYPNSVGMKNGDEDDVALYLAVKEYRPRRERELRKGEDEGVTVVAAGGNGFPKVRSFSAHSTCSVTC